MLNDIEEILYTEEQIATRVHALGAQISTDYQALGPDDLILVAVLRGAAVFLADLSRNIAPSTVVEFMVVEKIKKSDGNAEVKIIKDLDISITGRHVLVVEDIIDEGETLRFLLDALRLREPASLKVVTVFDKPSGRKTEIAADYVGFEVPGAWVVGYGLDYRQQYRNLPVLGVLKKEILTGS